MRKLVVTSLVATGIAILYACGGGEHKPVSDAGSGTENSAQTEPSTEAQATDAKKGIGKFTTVEISPTLDKAMADKGEAIAKTKCLSCHKLTEERLVGPGWAGVTKRRTAEWVMNFVTNTDEMLQKDPEAIAQLEICLVRMPNQNLGDDEARQIFEFMRKVDGVQ